MLAICIAAWLVVTLQPRRIRVLALERVPLGEMSAERFDREFAARKPVVLEGAWREEGWRPEQLAAGCALAEIRTFRFDPSSHSWARKEQVGQVPLKEYHSQYFAPAPSSRPQPVLDGFEMELKTHCPERLEHIKLPSFLTEDAFHVVTNRTGLGWPSVLFGPEGTQTGMHIDTHRLPFWIAVIAPASGAGRGLKRFRVFPHDDAKLLKYGRVTNAANYVFDYDPWQPNYRLYPDVADGHVFETELRSGDLLYIPGGSPHAVINLADNVAVSMNYLDLKTMPDFVRKCAPTSPLCGVVAGKGQWVLEALEERRALGKDMSYFEFAGFKSKSDFCDAHLHSAPTPGSSKGPRPALHEYCAGA